MNDSLSWCIYASSCSLFHDVTSVHPPSFHRNDFSTCNNMWAISAKTGGGAGKGKARTRARLASFPGLLPPSPLRMLASDNYAWVYLRREKAWYILSRDACRDCHKASSCGVVT